MVAMTNVIPLHIKNNLLHLDATEISTLIRTKKVSSEEVIRIYIDHIKAVNPMLNAVVEERFDAAIKEAKEKDANIDEANLKFQPLYGVPVSIKESIDVAGMKTTGGISHRADIIVKNDAHVVEQLKRAGAIILCKTNTPALCFCHETDNTLFGRTNNAWDMKRTAGGSSGGEGALIGVGGAPIGIGSDIGGSIRFPSHFNGVVGFKPGKNQVSTTGHFPPDTHHLKARMSTIGPIGKSVRDMKLLYRLIQQEQPRKALYERMQVDVLPADIGFPLSKKTTELLGEVYELVSHTYNSTTTIPPFFNDSATIWQEIMSHDGGREITTLAFNTDRVNIFKEYMKSKLKRNTKHHPYLLWSLVGANMFKPSQKRLKEMEQFLNEGDRTLDSYLSNRLLVFPVYHTGALKHGETYKEIFSIKRTFLQYLPYTVYANVWGLPSLVIPVGTDHNGLPIAIQVMSKVGNEDAIFLLGEKIEKHFGGYKRSTVYDKP